VGLAVGLKETLRFLVLSEGKRSVSG